MHCHQFTQTNLSMDDISKLENAHRDVIVEIKTLKNKVKKLIISEETFKCDDDRTKYYSALPNFAFLMAVFEIVSPDLVQTPCSALISSNNSC